MRERRKEQMGGMLGREKGLKESGEIFSEGFTFLGLLYGSVCY
jgi:hypothetical protein